MFPIFLTNVSERVACISTQTGSQGFQQRFPKRFTSNPKGQDRLAGVLTDNSKRFVVITNRRFQKVRRDPSGRLMNCSRVSALPHDVILGLCKVAEKFDTAKDGGERSQLLWV